MYQRESPPLTDCPNQETLTEFNEGVLSIKLLEEVAQHLARCASCRRRLQQLDQEPAIVLRGLRAAFTPHVHLVEGDCERLEASAKTLALQAGAEPATAPPARLDQPLLFETGPNPPNLEQYEILERVGHGGMGVVYKAKQVGLDRIVALKMILAPAGSISPAQLLRFHGEATKLARLQHPNIVSIYDIGELDQRPYFTMEFMDGGNLAEKLEKNPLPVRDAAELLMSLSRAMHYVHQRGLVHRDLKPANILLAADGTPKITDFGLVKDLQGVGLNTHTGDIIGTPAYMAPEQAAGRADQATAAADIYGLGAILYELLTAQPPFVGGSILETMKQVTEVEPAKPRLLRRTIPVDLETICLKCLRKEPHKRYASAQELADDLDRFLTNCPIQARPVSRAERLGRWARRNPALATVSALALVAALGLVGMTISFVVHQERALQESRRFNARLTFERGLELCNQGSVNSGLLWLLRSLELAPPGSDLEHVIRVNLAAWEPEACVLQSCFVYPKDVSSLAISPDGKSALTGCTDGAVLLWDLTAGREVLRLNGHTDRVGAVVFHPSEKIALTGSNDGTARLWNLANGKEMHRFPTGQGVFAAAFAPDGERIAITDFDNKVKCWETATGREWGKTGGLSGQYALAFSPDGKALIVDQNDYSLLLWDPIDGRELQRFRGPQTFITHIAFSPDGRRLASTDNNATVCLWDTANGTRLQQFSETQSVFLAIAFSPDGETLLFGGGDQVRMRDVKTWKPSRLPARLPGSIVHMGFTSDGQRLLTMDADKHGRLWKLGKTPVVAWRDPESKAVGKVAITSDGRLALVSNEPKDGKKCGAYLLDCGSGKCRLGDMPHSSRLNAIAISHDGRWLLTTFGYSGISRLWDSSSGQMVREFGGPSESVSALALSPDDSQIAAASNDGTAWLWNRRTGEAVCAPLKHAAGVYVVTFSPDGRTLLTGCADGKAQLWDASNGQPIGSSFRHEQGIKAAMFAPDGKTILTASADHTARLWRARDGQPIGAPLRHQNWVYAVAFSPDGSTVATASFDNTARLWDAQTGEPLGIPLRHQNQVRHVAFSPDSRVLVTASFDNTARLWDVTTSQPIGPPLLHFGQLLDLAVAQASNTFVTASYDGNARIWRIPQPLTAAIPQIRLRLQVQTGSQMGSQGGLHLLDAAVWNQLRQEWAGEAGRVADR